MLEVEVMAVFCFVMWGYLVHLHPPLPPPHLEVWLDVDQLKDTTSMEKLLLESIQVIQ